MVYSSTELNPIPWCSANHHSYLHVRLKLMISSWSSWSPLYIIYTKDFRGEYTSTIIGSIFTSDGRWKKEVKRCIGRTKKHSHLWRKYCAGEASVWRFDWDYRNAISGQLYYTDVKHRDWAKWLWKLGGTAEHWFLGRLFRILWTDKVSTCEVFRRAGVEKGSCRTSFAKKLCM